MLASAQVHEVAPGHFNATTSDRVDKTYKEVRTDILMSTSDASFIMLLAVGYALRRDALRFPCYNMIVLQVHDFAQTIKECEKQIKQLELATVGKLPLLA